MRRALIPLTLCIAMAVLAGCTATSVTLNFEAVKPVNQVGEDGSGDSRVVEVRIYQLKDDAKFKDATVDSLWTDDKAALGDSLIDVKGGESIFPEDKDQAQGKQITIEPLDAATRFIGILALFSKGDDQGDRKVVVPLDQADSVLFQLTGYHINVKSE